MKGLRETIAQRWAPQGDDEVLILDNRDSFVFNLAHRIAELGLSSAVVRSDQIGIEELEALAPKRLILSPGPGHPRDAGITVEVIRKFGVHTPILGICLGHQAIGMAFGAKVRAGEVPRHGVATWVDHLGEGVLAGLPSPFQAARYHSLLVEGLGGTGLRPTAWSEGVVMAMRHESFPIEGVQFHPESILTEQGLLILDGFLRLDSMSSS